MEAIKYVLNNNQHFGHSDIGPQLNSTNLNVLTFDFEFQFGVTLFPCDPAFGRNNLKQRKISNLVL